MPGKLRPDIMASTSRVATQDSYTFINVWRRSAGVEERVAAFNGQIVAMRTAAYAQAVPGDATQRRHVLYAPRNSGIRRGDEVWADDDRYRVIAVEQLAYQDHVILVRIQ